MRMWKWTQTVKTEYNIITKWSYTEVNIQVQRMASNALIQSYNKWLRPTKQMLMASSCVFLHGFNKGVGLMLNITSKSLRNQHFLDNWEITEKSIQKSFLQHNYHKIFLNTFSLTAYFYFLTYRPSFHGKTIEWKKNILCSVELNLTSWSHKHRCLIERSELKNSEHKCLKGSTHPAWPFLGSLLTVLQSWTFLAATGEQSVRRVSKKSLDY